MPFFFHPQERRDAGEKGKVKFFRPVFYSTQMYSGHLFSGEPFYRQKKNWRDKLYIILKAAEKWRMMASVANRWWLRIISNRSKAISLSVRRSGCSSKAFLYPARRLCGAAPVIRRHPDEVEDTMPDECPRRNDTESRYEQPPPRTASWCTVLIYGHYRGAMSSEQITHRVKKRGCAAACVGTVPDVGACYKATCGAHTCRT